MTSAKVQLRHRAREAGAAFVEFLISAPVLLLLGLGALQAGLMVHAHQIVTYATFEAAREGATRHAQPDAMRRALGVRLASLFGGDGSDEKVGEALLLGMAESLDPRYTTFEILNPTPQAFDDFAVPASDGFDEIPNHNLKHRPRDIGPTSGVNIQDANLLKIRVTYAYPLKVPVAGKVILAALRRLDRDNAHYYLLGRLPISSVATVHLQSPARRPGEAPVTDNGGAGEVPPLPGETPLEPDPDALPYGGGEVGEDEEGTCGPDSEATAASGGSATDASSGEGCGADSDQGADGEVQACGAGDGGSSIDDLLSPGQSSPVPGSSNPLEPAPLGAVTDNPNELPLQTVGNPIHVITGNKYQREVDLAPLQGGLAFIRHYNSRQAGRAGVLGHGWRHNFEAALPAGRELARQFERARAGEAAWPAALTVVQADGRALRFGLDRASVEDSAAPDQPQPAIAPAPSAEALATYRRAGEGELHYLGGPQPYLWRNGETHQRFDRDGRLTRLDAPGGRLRLTYTQGQLRTITDAHGRQLGFAYHTNGRLARLIDPAGHSTRYGYDARGNLTQVRRAQGTTRYGYDDAHHPHALTGRTDPAGQPAARYGYDQAGRAVLSERAGGLDRVELEYQSGFTLVTDARGQVSRYHHTRSNGVPVITRVEGPGCAPCGQTGDASSWVDHTYNDQAQLLETRSSDGRKLSRAYDARGRLLRLTQSGPDHPEHTTHFAYTGASPRPSQIRRPSVKPAAELVLSYEYDAQGRLLELVGQGYEPVWDAASAGAETGTQAKATARRVTTGPSVAPVAAADPVGTAVGYRPVTRRTTYRYDSEGRLLKTVGPGEGAISRYTYGIGGELTSLTDASGQTLRYLTHDAYGRPTQVESQGVVTTYHYHVSPPGAGADGHGRAPGGGGVVAIERGGRSVRNSYDASGRLLTTTDVSGRTRRFEYDAAGRMQVATSPDGARQEFAFDRAGQLTRQATVGAHGDLTTLRHFRHDPTGNLIGYQDQFGAVALQYAEQGRAVTLVPAHESQRPAEAGSGSAEPDSVVTPQRRYNNRGQLIERAGVHYRYDVNGQLAAVIMPTDSRGGADLSATTHYYHNDFAELALELSPERGSTHYQRDSSGQVTEVTASAGPSRQYAYDGVGRKTRETVGSVTTRYAYDRHGRLAEVVGPEVAERFTYTALGELESHTRILAGQTYVSRFEYDPQGRLQQQRTPAGPVLRYHYHTDGAQVGALARIEQLGRFRDRPLLSDLNQDARDRLSQLTYGNGLTETRRHSARGELVSLAVSGTLNLDYRYSATGEMATFTQVTPGRYVEQRYGYVRHRLSQIARHGSGAGHSHPAYEGYAYDAAGNRVSRTRVAADAEGPAKRLARTGSTDRVLRLDFTFYRYEDGSNRLAGITAAAPSGATVTDTSTPHDAAGRPLQLPLEQGLISYTYNAQGRPQQAHRHGQLIADYAYNHRGERIRKTVYSAAPETTPVTTYYLYERSRLIAEADAKGRITTQYHYQEGRPVGLWRGGAYYHLHTDHLGTPQAVTDQDGALVWRGDASPWGELVEDQDPDGDGDHFALALRLPGQLWDAETGSHYNYQRDYAPKLGRYLTPDPLGQAGGLNVYAYAEGNPLRYADPLGLSVTMEQTFAPPASFRIAVIECDPVAIEAAQDAINLLSITGNRSGLVTLYTDALRDLLANPYDSDDDWSTSFIDYDSVMGRPVDMQAPSPVLNNRVDREVVITKAQAAVLKPLVSGYFPDPEAHAMALLIEWPILQSTLGNQLRQTFGGLITDADVSSLYNSLPNPGIETDKIHFVDLAPLRDEIGIRMQTQLYAQPEVNARRLEWLEDLFWHEKITERYGDDPCAGGRGQAASISCQAFTESRQKLAESNSRLANVLSATYSQLFGSSDIFVKPDPRKALDYVVQQRVDAILGAPGSSEVDIDAYFFEVTQMTIADSIDRLREYSDADLSEGQVRRMFTNPEYAKQLLMDSPVLHSEYRNQVLNSGAPRTIEEAMARGFKQLPWYKSIFHNPIYAPTANSKWVGPGGHTEVVFDGNGNVVTDERYLGTFNFFGPDLPWDHWAADVEPYQKWGN